MSQSIDVLADIKKLKNYKRLKFQADIIIRLEIFWYKIKKLLGLIKE